MAAWRSWWAWFSGGRFLTCCASPPSGARLDLHSCMREADTKAMTMMWLAVEGHVGSFSAGGAVWVYVAAVVRTTRV